MDTFTIDGLEFVPDLRPIPDRAKPQKNKVFLGKPPRALEFYESLKDLPCKAVLEVGMGDGGSLIYFDKLFQPDILVGVDARKTPIASIEQYRKNKPNVKTLYGKPEDHAGTRKSVQAAFPGGIDLVVDDASHLYERTLATFESIFPLVKAGGIYVIEDWAWAHRPAYQAPDSPWANQPALTNLVLRLAIMSSVSRVIDSVTVNDTMVCVRKGKGMLPPGKLDISKNLRGKDLSLI